MEKRTQADLRCLERELRLVQLGWFHRYPARFSADVLAEIFRAAIGRLGCRPTSVFDPFAGTGATLSFARQLGIPSVGMELTSLGALICRVRLNPRSEPKEMVETAARVTSSCRNEARTEANGDLIYWMGERNAKLASALVNEIESIDDPQLRDSLLLALSSALRVSSRWLSGSIKPQLDPERDPPDLLDRFSRAVRSIGSDISREVARSKAGIESKIIEADSRFIPLPSCSIDAVITSPPYGTMYDYYDIHRLTYLAFSWEAHRERLIGRASRIPRDGEGFCPPESMVKWYMKEYSAESTVEGRALRGYLQDMNLHLREVFRVVRHGGVIAYAFGDSVRKGRVFPLVAALVSMMNDAGFADIRADRRSVAHRKILPAGRNSKTGRFDSHAKPIVREYIVTATKPGGS